jgi:hypothetical protein
VYVCGENARKPATESEWFAMTSDTPPDRLSNDPRSPYFDEEALARDVGIRFKGTEKTNVEEYCVSEGWIRVAAGNAKDRFGNPLTIKLTGKVEPYFKNKKPA